MAAEAKSSLDSQRAVCLEGQPHVSTVAGGRNRVPGVAVLRGGTRIPHRLRIQRRAVVVRIVVVVLGSLIGLSVHQPARREPDGLGNRGDSVGNRRKDGPDHAVPGQDIELHVDIAFGKIHGIPGDQPAVRPTVAVPAQDIALNGLGIDGIGILADLFPVQAVEDTAFGDDLARERGLFERCVCNVRAQYRGHQNGQHQQHQQALFSHKFLLHSA